MSEEVRFSEGKLLRRDGGVIPNTAHGASGSVPVPASPVAFTQTYSTAAATVPAATAAAVAGTAATNSTPFGYAQAQADAIVTAVNALVADVLAVRKTQNQIINILKTAGLAA